MHPVHEMSIAGLYHYRDSEQWPIWNPNPENRIPRSYD